MKKLCAVVFAALVSPVAFAQTCGAPGGPLTVAGTPITGDSCGGSNEFSQICGGGLTAGGASRTYQVQVGAGNSFTVTLTPTNASYDAAVFLVGPNACGATAPCAPGGDADNAGPGAAESIVLSGLAAGTYYIVVSSTNLSDPGGSCGPFSLNITGTLPVEVQSFSVE